MPLRQFAPASRPDKSSIIEKIGAVGSPEYADRILLDQKDGPSRGLQTINQLVNLIDDDRRKA